MILTGLRGVGKTVLLNEMLERARSEAWFVARVEADLGAGRTPFRNHVSAALMTSIRHAQSRPGIGARVKAAFATFKAFSLTASPDGSFSVGIDVDPA